MPATKDKEPTTDFAALASLLGDGVLPLDDVRKVADDLTIAKAFAAGLIEVGRRPHCFTGPVGKPGSALVVEDGPWDWSGPKTKAMKGLREIAADALPWTEKCRKYVLAPPPADRPTDEPALKPVEIPREEAAALLALHVRLTDKGLEAA